MVIRSFTINVCAKLRPAARTVFVYPHVTGIITITVITRAPIATLVPSEDRDTEYPDGHRSFTVNVCAKLRPAARTVFVDSHVTGIITITVITSSSNSNPSTIGR